MIVKEPIIQSEGKPLKDEQNSKRPRGKKYSIFIYRDSTSVNYILKMASIENLVIVKWIVIVNKSKILMWK